MQKRNFTTFRLNKQYVSNLTTPIVGGKKTATCDYTKTPLCYTKYNCITKGYLECTESLATCANCEGTRYCEETR
ncbi:MAG: hypothetical protein AAF611_11495 [Bacteroidota bacterium]